MNPSSATCASPPSPPLTAAPVTTAAAADGVPPPSPPRFVLGPFLTPAAPVPEHSPPPIPTTSPPPSPRAMPPPGSVACLGARRRPAGNGKARAKARRITGGASSASRAAQDLDRDGELFKLLENKATGGPHGQRDVSAEIDRLVEEGASVSRSKAIHMAVSNEPLWGYVEQLLGHDESALNHGDAKGVTPLHIAAAKAAVAEPVNTSLALKLVELGADTSATDTRNRTALEVMLNAIKDNEGFAACGAGRGPTKAPAPAARR